MISLLLALAFTGVTSDQQLTQDYATAYETSISEHKPLMVVVGAPWCPACRVLKESTIKPMAYSGQLDDVSLAIIDKEASPDLVEELTEGEKLLPQILVFTNEDGQWKRRKLPGYQTREGVRSLIDRALHK